MIGFCVFVHVFFTKWSQDSGGIPDNDDDYIEHDDWWRSWSRSCPICVDVTVWPSMWQGGTLGPGGAGPVLGYVHFDYTLVYYCDIQVYSGIGTRCHQARWLECDRGYSESHCDVGDTHTEAHTQTISCSPTCFCRDLFRPLCCPMVFHAWHIQQLQTD